MWIGSRSDKEKVVDVTEGRTLCLRILSSALSYSLSSNLFSCLINLKNDSLDSL